MCTIIRRVQGLGELLKEGYVGDYVGSIIGVIQGDTGSLDYS